MREIWPKRKKKLRGIWTKKSAVSSSVGKAALDVGPKKGFIFALYLNIKYYTLVKYWDFNVTEQLHSTLLFQPSHFSKIKESFLYRSFYCIEPDVS